MDDFLRTSAYAAAFSFDYIYPQAWVFPTVKVKNKQTLYINVRAGLTGRDSAFQVVFCNLRVIPIEHRDCLLFFTARRLADSKGFMVISSTQPVHLWLYLHMALRIRFNLLRQSNGLITLKRWQQRGWERGRSDTLNWLLMERQSHRAVEI